MSPFWRMAKKGACRSRATEGDGSTGSFSYLLRCLGQLVLLVVLVLVIGSIFYGINTLRSVPLGEIHIYGFSGSEQNNRGATEEELFLLMLEYMDAGFWQLNLPALQAALESHPWVRSAAITRRWPNSLRVGIDEHVPIARWNKTHLLASSGHLYSVPEAGIFSSLPQFSVAGSHTPKQRDIVTVVQQFNAFQRALKPQHQTVVELGLSPSADIWLGLESGARIELGKRDQLLRLQRLSGLIETGAIGRWEQIAVADLRYPSGVSVRWVDDEMLEDDALQQIINSAGLAVAG